jgi:GTPase SAR1 family protein
LEILAGLSRGGTARRGALLGASGGARGGRDGSAVLFFLSFADFSAQVVLLGEGSVGKTSLVLRYCKDEFNDKHLTTIQASFFAKRISVGQARVKLAIWDTAGQERYAALGPIYYRDANGALLVYDITDRQSFDRVKQWVRRGLSFVFPF